MKNYLEKASGIVGWKSPSNIALIKYWGKHGNQLPRNPSLSFSLSEAHTETKISYDVNPEKTNPRVDLEFLFEGKRNEAFEKRIQNYLDSLSENFPFLKKTKLKIESKNSFPHSSGIASSASSMSALALCLTDIETTLEGGKRDDAFYKKASNMARLGSGSACRSVYKDFCVWGANSLDKKYTDEYAVALEVSHPVFENLHDDILIVSSVEKTVSSSAGHKLMETNPFSKTRYAQANERLPILADMIAKGDIEAFGKIVEEEALCLHALMMCSDPSYILMEPASLKIINKIRSFRRETGTPIYFTLDAGPNVHIIYPDSVKEKASDFIKGNLLQYCEEGRHIFDKMGTGPEKII